MMLPRYFLLLLLGFSALAAKPAYAAPVNEYELKTAYLYNFALFTTWPSTWPPEAGGTMSICTLGQDQFGASIDQLNGRKVRGKRLLVRRAITTEEAASCHIVYISSSEHQNLPKILGALRKTSVMTVTDRPVDRPTTVEVDEEGNAVPQRCTITLVLENKRLQFEVDSAQAKHAGLLLSSRLLYLARHVY
jgi:hypothetical protein